MKHVADYMTKNAVSINAEEEIVKAVEVMQKNNVGALLVKEKGKVIGIFTERDVLKKINIANAKTFLFKKVKTGMTKKTVSIDHKEAYLNVIEIMKKKKTWYLPVLVKGKVKGIISLRDFFNKYNKQLEFLLREREKEIEANFRAVRESEERFRTIFDNSAIAITLADNKERIAAWNPFAAKLLGMSERKLRGMRVRELYPPEERKKLRSLNVKKLGLNHHVETKIWNNKKKKIDVDVSLSVLKDTDGKLQGSIGIIRDITKRKKTEEELRIAYKSLKEAQTQLIQAEKLYAVGQLASGVAHEVRNPLEIILQGINFLEKKVSIEEKEAFMVFEMVKDGVERAANIISSLLDFSKASALKLTEEDINSTLDTAIGLVKTKIKEEHINLGKEMNRKLPKIKVDQNKISQVFINMFINAIYATPAGGKIWVRTSCEKCKKAKAGAEKGEKNIFEKGETAVVVEVEDTGVGIEKEHLRKIFDPFFTTKGPKGGAGLGLSVSHNILKMHGAVIEAESKKGKGTKMKVYFKIMGGEK